MSLVVPKNILISTYCRIWTPWVMCLHSLWRRNNLFYAILLDTPFCAPTSLLFSEDTAWAPTHCGTRGSELVCFGIMGLTPCTRVCNVLFITCSECADVLIEAPIGTKTHRVLRYLAALRAYLRWPPPMATSWCIHCAVTAHKASVRARVVALCYTHIAVHLK